MSTIENNQAIIGVIGATGKIGSELVRQLSDAGAHVRAFSRKEYQGDTLPHVEWQIADLSDKEDFTKKLQGVHSFFMVTENAENMVKLQRNGIAAAKDAGVKRIVKISALGASEHSTSIVGLWHANIERTLAESGLEWTSLRPHSFMQNLLAEKENLKNGHLYSAAGDGKIPFIDVRDIAASAVEILMNGGWNGKKPVLTGPSARSYDEIATIFSTELGHKVEHIRENEDETWKRIRAANVPAWFAAGLLALAGYWRKGGTTALITNTVKEITGKPARSVEDFVHDYKDYFTA